MLLQVVAARRMDNILDRVCGAFQEDTAAQGGSVLTSRHELWAAGGREPLPLLP